MGKEPGWSDNSGENEISRESMVLFLYSIYVYSCLFISLKVGRCLKAQNKINPKLCSKVGCIIGVCNCSHDMLRFCSIRKEMLLKIGQWLCNDI